MRPVATGRPSAYATRIPTWKPPESADSLPKKTRSNAPLARLVDADRLDDRAGGRLRIPLFAVGDEVDGAVGAERHRVAELLLGLGRPEREHDRLAAVRLDQADRLLDAALLVRADREPEVLRLDRLRVLGEHDLPARHRHPLDADEDPHDRILVFSGSKIGAEPTTSTVTGYCSPMYSTASRVPTSRLLGREIRHEHVLPHRGRRAGARHVGAATLRVDERARRHA